MQLEILKNKTYNIPFNHSIDFKFRLTGYIPNTHELAETLQNIIDELKKGNKNKLLDWEWNKLPTDELNKCFEITMVSNEGNQICLFMPETKFKLRENIKSQEYLDTIYQQYLNSNKKIESISLNNIEEIQKNPEKIILLNYSSYVNPDFNHFFLTRYTDINNQMLGLPSITLSLQGKTKITNKKSLLDNISESNILPDDSFLVYDEKNFNNENGQLHSDITYYIPSFKSSMEDISTSIDTNNLNSLISRNMVLSNDKTNEIWQTINELKQLVNINKHTLKKGF